MVNRPKVIGTAGESAIIRFLKVSGFPHAERRALAGAADMGDVTGIPGICIEVKAGEVAKGLHPSLVSQWLRETEIERLNSNSDIGLLVVQRRGFGITRAGYWWTILPSYVCMLPNVDPHGFVMLPFSDAVTMLRRMGYGQSSDG
jgi:hypothetical protein